MNDKRSRHVIIIDSAANAVAFVIRVWFISLLWSPMIAVALPGMVEYHILPATLDFYHAFVLYALVRMFVHSNKVQS